MGARLEKLLKLQRGRKHLVVQEAPIGSGFPTMYAAGHWMYAWPKELSAKVIACMPNPENILWISARYCVPVTGGQ